MGLLILLQRLATCGNMTVLSTNLIYAPASTLYNT
jgi:hypothetical protein